MEKARWKILVIYLLTAGMAGVFGYLFEQAAFYSRLDLVSLAGLVAMLSVAILGIGFLCLKDFRYTLPLAALYFWTFFFFGTAGFPLYRPGMFFGAAGVFLLTLIYAAYATRRVLNRQITFDFFDFSRSVTPALFLGNFIFVIGIYVSGISLTKTEVSPSAIETILSPLSPSISRFMPEFSPDLRLKDFLPNFVARVYGPRADVSGTSENLRQAFSSVAERQIDYSRTISETVSLMINGALKKAPDQIKETGVAWLGVLAFLFFSGFAFLFHFLIGLLGYVLVKLLFWSKFMYISVTKVEKEVVSI